MIQRALQRRCNGARHMALRMVTSSLQDVPRCCMRIDMCIDIYADMCADMCIDTRIGICVDMCIDMQWECATRF